MNEYSVEFQMQDGTIMTLDVMAKTQQKATSKAKTKLRAKLGLNAIQPDPFTWISTKTKLQ